MNPARVAVDADETLGVVRRALDLARRRRHALEGVWEDLLALARLVGSWARGEYAGLPWRSLVLAVGALLYFLDPFDVIPDQLPLLGYVDDASLIALVAGTIRGDLARFLRWEQARPGARRARG